MISRRKSSLRLSGISIFSSIDRISRSDRKSTRLNSSHLVISYAVFCLKKKKKNDFAHHVKITIGTYIHSVRQVEPHTHPRREVDESTCVDPSDVIQHGYVYSSVAAGT